MSERRKASRLRFLMSLSILSVTLSLIVSLSIRVSAGEFPPRHPFKELFEGDLVEIAEGMSEIVCIYVEHWFSIIDAAHVHIEYVPGLSQDQEIALQFDIMNQIRTRWFVRYAEPNYIYTIPELPPPNPPFEIGALNVGFVTATVVPDSYLTIQEAIDNSPETGIVFVRSGVYHEHLVLNKTLTLAGEERDMTIINGRGAAPAWVVIVAANNVKMHGFTVQNSEGSGGAVWVNGYFGATISDSIIANNGDGIRVLNSSGNTICNNLIRSNLRTGVGLDWSFDNIVRNNTIADNNVGIGATNLSCNNTFSENTISNNDYGFLTAFHDCKLFHNNIANNGVQVTFYSPERVNVWDDGYPNGGNYWSDYAGVDLHGGPYQNETGSDGIGDEAYVIGASNQDRYPTMQPFCSVRNLNTGLVYSTIQSSINAPETLAHHTIFVRSGTYRGSVVVNKTISLVGESEETTIIDGCNVVDAVCINANNVEVSRFQVCNGFAGLRLLVCNNTVIHDMKLLNNQCGICLYDCWFTNITSCRIENTTENSMLLSNSHSNVISGNLVSKSQGCGLQLSSSSNNTIENNVVSDQVQGSSNGIELEHSHSNLIVNNTVSNNGGFGILLESSNKSLVFYNNLVNNMIQVYLHESFNNTWDNGFEGNHWSNYNGSDLNSDGIGDEYLPWEGVDYYPLISFYWNSADVNHDLKVDLKDVYRTGKAYGSYPGHPAWDPRCDTNHDSKIDLMDYYLVCRNYGRAYG